MAILEVLHFPDERLRQQAMPVDDIDQTIAEIVENMFETMYQQGGIGLAAIQVNIPKRIVVIDLSKEKNQPLLLINPQITAAKGKESMREGCLSVPDYFDVVERADAIEFSYENLEKETLHAEAEGLLAVCIQHEIDHLNGKLFIDYLSPLKRQRIKKKIAKQEKLNNKIL